MRLGALLPDIPLEAATADVDVDAICCDARQATQGCLFVALQGKTHDGHTFIGQAIAHGACAVLCERPIPGLSVPHVVLPELRRTMAQVARRLYGDPAASMLLVGITGTNGKTRVAHLVEGMLQAAGHTTGLIGTLGHRFGSAAANTFAPAPAAGTLTTPESVDLLRLLAQMRQAGVTAVAMEVSSQGLAQHRLDGVAFDVGVFTNLTHDHLDFPGSLEAYFAAKVQLFAEHLKPHGRGVLNADDTRVRALAQAPHPNHRGYETFSAHGCGQAADSQWADMQTDGSALTGSAGRACVFVQQCAASSAGTRLLAHTPRGSIEIHSQLLGPFNVQNTLAALAVGEVLQLPQAAMAKGLSAVGCIVGRLQRISVPGEPLVVVDYAHTPDALQQALRAVRRLAPGQLVCVFGCGGDRDPHKRAAMGRIACLGADYSIVTDDNPRSESPAHIAAAIVQGLEAAGGRSSEVPVRGGYRVMHDRGCAIAQAIAAAQPGDCVLIAGKGHETYQIVGALRRDFDDGLHARRALDARASKRAGEEG
jgi:UDP-N-acetylmuramoyl-L-alanyl-D-glutamate--2,6-diaminopimelate ligase